MLTEIQVLVLCQVSCGGCCISSRDFFLHSWTALGRLFGSEIFFHLEILLFARSKEYREDDLLPTVMYLFTVMPGTGHPLIPYILMPFVDCWYILPCCRFLKHVAADCAVDCAVECMALQCWFGSAGGRK